jgi:hypothetical protein
MLHGETFSDGHPFRGARRAAWKRRSSASRSPAKVLLHLPKDYPSVWDQRPCIRVTVNDSSAILMQPVQQYPNPPFPKHRKSTQQLKRESAFAHASQITGFGGLPWSPPRSGHGSDKGLGMDPACDLPCRRYVFVVEDDQHRSLVAGEWRRWLLSMDTRWCRDAGASILRGPERRERGGRTNYTAL